MWFWTTQIEFILQEYDLKYDSSSINLKLSAEEQIDKEEIKKKIIKEIQRNSDKDVSPKKWVSGGLYIL